MIDRWVKQVGARGSYWLVWLAVSAVEHGWWASADKCQAQGVVRIEESGKVIST